MTRGASRRDLLVAAGVATFVGLPGCADRLQGARGVVGDRPTATGTSTGSETATPGATPAETVEPSPDAFTAVDVTTPGSRYATMGREDAPAAATVYGGWKCPYTRKFVTEQLPGLVDRFVRTGRARVRFRAVAYRDGEPFHGPDEPDAATAGLAVWRTRPDRYWRYFGTVFANQPPADATWATAERLGTFAAAAGVADADPLRDAIESARYRDDLQATQAAVRRLDLAAVPRVVVDGAVTAPLVDPRATVDAIERAAGGEGPP